MAEPEMHPNECTDTNVKVKKEGEKKQISLDIPFNNNRKRVNMLLVLHETQNMLQFSGAFGPKVYKVYRKRRKT